MKAHFAIIKSLTSRYSNQSIVEVHEVTDGMSNDKTISPCGRFFTYGIGYMFKSEVVTIELDEIDDFEREIDACDDAIRGLTSAMYKRLETELEVPKARKLELQQLVHMPAVDVTYPEPNIPDAAGLDECEDAYQESLVDPAPKSNIPPDSEYAEDLPDDQGYDDGPYNGLVDDEDGI